MSIRVVLVDDNDLLRAGLRTVLGSDPSVTVVGEASDGVAAVRLARELAPEVVLMDVEMPGGDGVTATRSIVGSGSAVRVLVLTMFDLDEYVVDALRAGASGFVLKTAGPAELLRAVHACAAGELALGPTVTARLVAGYLESAPPPDDGRLASLTPRELEVLRAMADGLSNAEVGKRLHLAETTVKTHVARVLAKLAVRDRVQAVVLAHRHGLARR